jgi:anti-sigma regulatory factor (Ser/Thr protein kinase)
VTDFAELHSLDLRDEPDVFVARQNAHAIAGAVGLDVQDQVRVATAVSEVAREAVAAGGGRLVFGLDDGVVLCVVLDQAAAAPP